MEIDYGYLSVLDNYLLIVCNTNVTKFTSVVRTVTFLSTLLGTSVNMVDEKNIIRQWASLVLTFSGHPTFN